MRVNVELRHNFNARLLPSLAYTIAATDRVGTTVRATARNARVPSCLLPYECRDLNTVAACFEYWYARKKPFQTLRSEETRVCNILQIVNTH